MVGLPANGTRQCWSWRAALSRRSPRVRSEPGAAVARQGLRAAGPAAESVPESAKVHCWLETAHAPCSGPCSPCVALFVGPVASPHGAQGG